MKWAVWTLAALAALVAGATVVGWMLPVRHEAAVNAFFARPPEEIYETVADVSNYPAWFDEVSRVEMLDAPDGRVRFREHMSAGAVVMEVDQAVPSSRFVTRIADPDQPFGGTWTFDIAAENGGARLTITERGEVYNPLFRFLARFVFGYTGTMSAFLRSLERKFSA